jgi:putative NADH-flavin reductase
VKIAVIGAAGNLGSRVVAEALRRGHRVTALTRADADATDTARVTELLSGHDVGVGATRQAPGQEGAAASVTRALLDAHAAAGVRFVLVGGSGCLHVPRSGGRYAADDPRWVPAEFRNLAASSIDQLRECREHAAADWTFLAASALMEPGLRTGRYRTGSGELLIDETGASYVSMEDMAVAVLDEIERPAHRRALLTVASSR